jgi:hypothetical protein
MASAYHPLLRSKARGGGARRIPRTPVSVDEALAGYSRVAVDMSADGDDFLDPRLTVRDLTSDALAEMRQDVQTFLERAGDDAHMLPAEQIGAYFWLTRNRLGIDFCGMGFGAAGDRLTQIAESYSEVTLWELNDERTSRLVLVPA